MGATQGHADARALDPLHSLRSHEPLPVAAPKPCPLCVCVLPPRFPPVAGLPRPARSPEAYFPALGTEVPLFVPPAAPSWAAAVSVLPIVSLPKPRPHWVEGEGQGCPHTCSPLCRLQLRGSSGPKFREGKVEGTLMT